MEQHSEVAQIAQEQPGAPGQSRRRRRRPQSESQWHKMWRLYSFEVIWVIVVVAGLALVKFDPASLRSTMTQWLRTGGGSIGQGLSQLGKRVTEMIGSIGPADVVGVILVVGAFAALFWRLRWQLMRNEVLTTARCPKCRGSLQRIHRHQFDRVINAYVPVRRYHCGSNTCHWQGLRIVVLGGRGGNRR
jgi:hypothetical protein